MFEKVSSTWTTDIRDSYRIYGIQNMEEILLGAGIHEKTIFYGLEGVLPSNFI